MCSGSGSGASRCALRLSRCDGRLDTLRHATGAHALGGRSRCCSRQARCGRTLLRVGRCRCAGWQDLLFATGAVAPGGKRWPSRSRCAWWQETLQRAAGAVSWAAAGVAAAAVVAGVRRRFTVWQEPRRVDVQQETRLWVTAEGPRQGRAQGVAHEEASCWGSSLKCVWRAAAHLDVVCSWCKRGGVGRGTHTSEEGVVVCLSAGAPESHQVGLSMAVAVDKEELRTGERGVEPCPIRQQLAEPHTTSGPWEMELWTAITIQKLGVEKGLIQTLAVWTPGPSWCVIASYRRQGLQLAQVRAADEWQGRT